ncbi:MAG: ADP-forming succinate--CoA ligase subunit beta [Myxococcota bacterium]|jgi:succinyl-CoA synthetase beta subunit|nr:ADP-forming succinate--CoA ligase subunit beta [Myxococcota bacterium]
MKIHEFQAKALLAARGLPVPAGRVAASADEAVLAATALGGERGWVVKAQVHAGGRGKGGGVVRCGTGDEVREAAARILARPLVTPQTGPQGRPVRRLLIERAATIERELYLALTLDRAHRRLVLIGSAAGGMEIEEVAARHPDQLVRILLDPLLGLPDFQARRLAEALGLAGALTGSFVRLAQGLHRLYLDLDCSLVEVNPLVLTREGELLALDAKLAFDPAALPRHPELLALADPTEEDPVEHRAAQAGLSYVQLDGEVGCMVNGAGLAMATMDLVLEAGRRPANFLDVGGAATVERVAAALGLILEDPRVRVVFINIFGGIVRCDVVAAGIAAACRGRPVPVPLVVRLVGTNEEEGRRILAETGLPIHAVETMAEGAAALAGLVRASAGGRS